MPSASLLSDNAIGTLQLLCFVFADVMLKFGREDTLIPTPVVAIELLAGRFSLSVDH
jgi:hypothetical protein